MRPQYDRQHQLEAYHQFQEMLHGYNKEERMKWVNHRGDTLGVEPDFPTHIFE